MDQLSPIDVVLVLLVASTALEWVARRTGIAHPILLVIGGLVLGIVVRLPAVTLEPDLVFLLFLPPILFGAAFDTPIRDFKANLRAIGLLAVGLVLFTTVVVAVVAHALVPNLGWAAAFTLGAIVAPPDAVSATAVLQRLGVPARIQTILAGESLVNDASALIAYRFAVAAALTGTFSIVDAGVSFVAVGVGGIAVGVAAGLLLTSAWRRTSDPGLEIILSLLAPIASYQAAETLGLSGVLAAVTAGLIAGRRAARALTPDGRVMGRGVWGIVYFLIDSFVFMLIGLQLPTIIAAVSVTRSPAELVGLGVAISLTVIVARIVWVVPATYLPHRLSASIRAREASPPPNQVAVVAWAGMRGAVTLAAALALPTQAGAFPDRDLIVYLAFCVILATLVGQGLTLAPLIRWLQLVPGDVLSREEQSARQAAIEAARTRLDQLAATYPDHLPLVDQMRARFDHEAEHAWPDEAADIDEEDRERLEHQEIRLAVVEAQRDAVIRLRDEGAIGDEALRRVERDLDLEALRSGV